MRERIALIEQHGVDTVVLAGAVLVPALFAAATAAGHSADPADITARIAEIKTLLAEGLHPELEGYVSDVGELEGYVSAVGEQVYFTEMLPRGLAMELAIASWRKELLADLTSLEDVQRAWCNAERDALTGAQVTLSNESGLDATIESATAYLEAYWGFVSSPTPTPSPHSAPAP